MNSCIFDGRRQHRASSYFVYDILWVKTRVTTAQDENSSRPTNFKSIMNQVDMETETDTDEEIDSSKKQCDALRGCFFFKDGSEHSHISNVAVNSKNPFITNDDDDSSESDNNNNPSVFLIAQSINGITTLETHVYLKNVIQHCFNLPIPPQPMCMEWLDYDPDEPNNLCAIGSMKPIIKIWNLCLVNNTKPFFKLGRKANVSKRQEHIGHRNMVVDLAWNQNLKHILASSSIDGTILLWDLELRKPIKVYDAIDREAFSLKWNPQETERLLTGCLDKKVRIRDPNQKNTVVKRWNVPGLPQKVLWNHYNTNYCSAGLEGGFISYFDVRTNKAVWEIRPHGNGNVTGLTLSVSYPGLLISSSDDGLIKVWDIINHEPILVYEKRDPSIQLHIAPNPYNELILSVHSMKPLGGVHTEMLDLSMIPEVRDRFADRIVSHSSVMNITEEMKSMEIDE